MSNNVSDNVYDLFTTEDSITNHITLHELEQPTQTPFPTHRAYNPCIFTLENYNTPFVAYRMCNFYLCPEKRNPWDKDNRELTNSHTLIYRPDGERYLIKYPNISGAKCEKGCEDARIIVHHDKMYMFCNTTSGPKCQREMNIMELDVSAFTQEKTNVINTVEINNRYILRTPVHSGRDEKNWMPFIHENGLYFVYSVNPHVILKHEGAGNCSEIARTYNSSLPTDLRGGSQIIRTKKWNMMYPMFSRGIKYVDEDIYIGVLHIRTSLSSYYTYIYGFEINYPFKVKYITKGFIFGDVSEHVQRIQFASGLARVMHDDVPFLHISYGEHDCTSKLCIIKEEDVMRALVKIEIKE